MEIVPESRRLLTEKEIHDYVYGKYLRWLEYTGNDEYNVRSDNNLNTNFRMTAKQLLVCFHPCEIEENLHEALRYFHWLGELGISDVDDSISYIVSRNKF